MPMPKARRLQLRAKSIALRRDLGEGELGSRWGIGAPRLGRHRKEGQVMVLLDGLQEMPADGACHKVSPCQPACKARKTIPQQSDTLQTAERSLGRGLRRGINPVNSRCCRGTGLIQSTRGGKPWLFYPTQRGAGFWWGARQVRRCRRYLGAGQLGQQQRCRA